jgi:iron complex outermembrane receptor protein
MGVVDNSLIRKYSPTVEPIHPKVFRNISQAMKAGVEVNGTLSFATNFKFSTDISYVYTENQTMNESLPLTPPLMARLKLEYERKIFWLNLRMTIAGDQNRISSAFNEIPTQGYEVFDFEAGIIPIRNLKIGLAALNILNKHYVNHLSFAFNNVTGFGRVPIPEPGRNLTVFASYSF